MNPQITTNKDGQLVEVNSQNFDLPGKIQTLIFLKGERDEKQKEIDALVASLVLASQVPTISVNDLTQLQTVSEVAATFPQPPVTIDPTNNPVTP